MRNESLNHKFVFDSPMPLARLVTQVADRSQVNTQRSSKRPYGVGLLIGGVDSSGPRLFQTDSSGNYFEYQAIAIGGRSQAAKTYLEKHFQSFKDEESKGTKKSVCIQKCQKGEEERKGRWALVNRVPLLLSPALFLTSRYAD